MKYRIIDESTLRAMQPLIQRIADDLAEAYGAVVRAAGRGDGVIDEELAPMRACIEEIESLGGTVRTLEPVELEFLAEQAGSIGYMTWCQRTGAVGPFRVYASLFEPEPVVA